MNKMIGYIRVSTREQSQSRNGLDAQKAELERFAKDNSLDIVDILEETATGSDDSRPILQSAIEKAKKLRCALVVSKLDRYSRSVSFISTSMNTLKRAHVLFYVTALGIDTDPFLMHLYAAFAEKERQMISTRTREALAAAKSRGVVLGNLDSLASSRAAGVATSKKNAAVFANRVRAPIERMIRDKMSYKQIADEMNNQMIPTARGGCWSAALICTVVKRLKQ